MLSGFSREPAYHRYSIARGLSILSVSAHDPDLPGSRLPTSFNLLFRQQAGVSLLRLHVAPYTSNGPDPISVDQESLVLWRGGFSPPLSLLIPTFAFP